MISTTVSHFQIPDFTKVGPYACSKPYGEYLTAKEANLACADDPKCKFIQRYRCNYMTIFPNSKLCGYDSDLVASTSSCVYKKYAADIKQHGSIFFITFRSI